MDTISFYTLFQISAQLAHLLVNYRNKIDFEFFVTVYTV